MFFRASLTAREGVRVKSKKNDFSFFLDDLILVLVSFYLLLFFFFYLQDTPLCSFLVCQNTKDTHISKENDRARDLPVTLQFQNLYEITVLPQFSFLFVISPFLLQICFL